MTRALLYTALLATAALATAQQPAPTPASGTDAQVEKLLGEAQQLQGRKRFLDALGKLDEAEKLAPKNAAVFNIRGAIYLAGQVRDVEKARQQFKLASELQPNEMPPVFNLTEVDYVTGQWEAAEKGLSDLEKRFPKLPSAVRHLVVFKRVVCLVKLNRIPDAETLTKENFTFMDDTPAYYFAKSVIASGQKKDTESNEWLLKAQHIFKQPDNAAYLDSLMESGFIHSLSVPKPANEAPARLGPAKTE